MELYSLIKILHIVGSTILFGTGIGIAFFMFRSHFTDDIHEKLYAVRNTVLADYLFTLPAVILQPITGIWLMLEGNYGWIDTWLLSTFLLYIFVGCFWLPVVWIQIQLKKILQKRISEGSDLPDQYYKLFKIWFLLGWPAFTGLLVIFYLMVVKPI